MLRGRLPTSNKRSPRNIQDLTPSLADTVPGEAAPFARQRVIRRVRPARRLSSPSMGRDTLTLPKQTKQQRQGGQGLGSRAEAGVAGMRALGGGLRVRLCGLSSKQFLAHARRTKPSRRGFSRAE